MKKLHRVIGAVLLAAVMMWTSASHAENFQTDLTGIQQAADSVVMLQSYDREDKPQSAGIGFVAYDGKTVITSYRVLKDAYRITAATEAGRQYDINGVLGAEPGLGVAVLLINGSSAIPGIRIRRSS